MGAGYSTDLSKEKLKKARQSRFASGGGRLGRLIRLRLLNQGATLVHAGTLPRITYGSGLHEPTRMELKALGRVYDAGARRALGAKLAHGFLFSLVPGLRRIAPRTNPLARRLVVGEFLRCRFFQSNA